MKLVLFGGVQGVGKTTLLSWLEEKYSGQLVVLDAGELFRRYAYGNRKTKTAEEVEELIMNTILGVPSYSVVVVHWHYAVRRPEGYIPQVSFSRLARISRSGKIVRATLLLVEAPAESILRRRITDREEKTRLLSLAAIRQEMGKEEEFFAKTHDILTRGLGRNSATTFRLSNTRLSSAKKRLTRFFEVLLDC